jgi:Inner membrane protein YgaP-like, transmembrane domain
MFAKIFPKNENVADRVVRVVLGVLGLSLVFIGPRTAWGWVGLLPLVTGLVGDCPLYTVMGWSTCPRHERT